MYWGTAWLCVWFTGSSVAQREALQRVINTGALSSYWMNWTVPTVLEKKKEKEEGKKGRNQAGLWLFELQEDEAEKAFLIGSQWFSI